MKLFIVLAVVAWSNAAKLDKTYLPPSNSQTSGGSGNFLQTPLAGPADYQGQSQDASFARNGNGFAQRGNVLARNGNGFSQNENGFVQNGNGFAQNGNGFAQNRNGFAQNGNDLAQNGNGFAQNGNGVASQEYSQNGNEYSQNGNSFSNFGSFENRPERAQAALERNAAILRQDNQNDGETFSYAFETENGIYAEENGVATNGVEAQGGFSYTGDDGQIYSIRYTADQNGFVPQGDHLPTPPPVPEEILKALEQNSRDEAAGIYDDGSYNDGKYSNSEDQYSSNQYNNVNSNNGNAFNNQNENKDDDDTVVTNNALFRNSGNGFNRAQQNGASNQGSFNTNQGANTAYLPPSQGSFNNVASNQGGFNSRVSNQRFNSGANQGSFNNGASSLRGFNSRANQGSFNNGASTQGDFNSGANQGSFNNGASTAGDFENGANQGSYNNGAFEGGLNRGATQGANKAYLPPFASQRNSGFGSRSRQPSFSARNGYRY